MCGKYVITTHTMNRLDEAFNEVNRVEFLPPEVKEFTDIDAPLQIGFGQTNSQPYTVKKMLAWLDVQPGDKVLDVGSGSGWTSALLAHLTGQLGSVMAVEIVPELVAMGRRNCQRLGVNNVVFFQAEQTFGLPAEAPFDKILVSATAKKLPNELVAQLKPGGKMVIPIKGSIWEIRKKKNGELIKMNHPGFAFVPLIG